LLPPYIARLKVDWDESQKRRDAEAELDEALTFPGLRAGLIDFEDAQTTSKFGTALSEGVQTRSENDLLLHALRSSFLHEIFDEARASYDRGTEGTRERTHIRTAAPLLVWAHDLQADCIFEYMRQRIDLHM